MTTEYINAAVNDTVDFSFVADSIDFNLINETASFQRALKPVKGKDSLVTLLERSLGSLRRIIKTRPSIKGDLLSCIILLRLWELGQPAAYQECHKTLMTAMRKYPDIREFPWLKGLLLIQAGQILDGLRLMDSLRTHGCGNQEFLSDYARYAIQALVPSKALEANDVWILDKTGDDLPDTAFPVSVSWKVVNTADSARSFPSFMYGASFTFEKPMPLHFNGLNRRQERFTLVEKMTRYSIPSTGPLVNWRYQKQTTATCRIYIDLSETATPLVTYLKRRIDGLYDSIETRDDLRQSNAVSIRCYSWNFSPEQNGTYTAYITFDRFLGDLRAAQTLPPSKRKDLRLLEKIIRFTISIQSGIDVKNLTEAKLQAILNAF